MDTDFGKSLERTKMIRGFVVRRMPLGAYLRAIDALKTAPAELMRDCFSETASVGEALDLLTRLDADGLGGICEALAEKLPGYALKVISAFCGIDERELIESEELGLDGLIELIDAVIELNGLGKLQSGLKKTLSALGMKADGFKG